MMRFGRVNSWNTGFTEADLDMILQEGNAHIFNARKNYYEEGQAREKAIQYVKSGTPTLGGIRKELKAYLQANAQVEELAGTMNQLYPDSKRGSKALKIAIRAEGHLMAAKVLQIIFEGVPFKPFNINNPQHISELIRRYC